MSGTEHTIFTATSFFSLAGVLSLGIIAYIGANLLLPKNAPWINRCEFAFDATRHRLRPNIQSPSSGSHSMQ